MQRRDYWNFYSAGRIVFGSGVIDRLAKFIRPWAVKRALVVTDPALVRAGVVAKVIDPLRSAGVELTVFDGGEPEPSFAVADRATTDLGPRLQRAYLDVAGAMVPAHFVGGVKHLPVAFRAR